MKALVISGSSEIYDYVSPLLKEKGYDLIHYRWIVKALDNIEEIQPDVIVLSAVEYPRHWKTLAGFIQGGIGGNNVKVYLYQTAPLSVEDAQKAEQLGIVSFEDEFKKLKFSDVEVAFNESCGPIHFCSGKFYEDKKLVELKIDKSDKVELTNVSYFKYLSIFDGNDVCLYTADVEAYNDETVSLKVREL